jgi:hypothetical protein
MKDTEHWNAREHVAVGIEKTRSQTSRTLYEGAL